MTNSEFKAIKKLIKAKDSTIDTLAGDSNIKLVLVRHGGSELFAVGLEDVKNFYQNIKTLMAGSSPASESPGVPLWIEKNEETNDWDAIDVNGDILGSYATKKACMSKFQVAQTKKINDSYSCMYER